MLGLAGAAAIVFCGPAGAKTTVIGFDDIPEGTIATNQFGGVTFTGASVLTEGSELNSAYPPVSPPNVVYDYLDGIITLNFSTNVDAVGAFVTGDLPISESIFNGATLLGTTTTGGANEVGSGTGLSPNIFLNLASSTDITSAVFDNGTGGTESDTFTLDNVTVDGGAITVSGVPEPSTWLLMIAGIGSIGVMLRRTRKTMDFRFKDAFSA